MTTGDRSREHTLPRRRAVERARRRMRSKSAVREPRGPERARKRVVSPVEVGRQGAARRRQEEYASVFVVPAKRRTTTRTMRRVGSTGQRCVGGADRSHNRQFETSASTLGWSERLTDKRGSWGARPGTLGEGVAQDLAGARAITRVLATCANAGLAQFEKRRRAHLGTVCPHEIFAVNMCKSERKTFHSPNLEKKILPRNGTF